MPLAISKTTELTVPLLITMALVAINQILKARLMVLETMTFKEGSFAVAQRKSDMLP